MIGAAACRQADPINGIVIAHATIISARVGDDCTLDGRQTADEGNVISAFFKTIGGGITSATGFAKFGRNRILVEGVGQRGAFCH